MICMTPEWIDQRLKETGIKAVELANAIGLETDKMSKSLNNKRDFKPKELIKILEYFGIYFEEKLEGSRFSKKSNPDSMYASNVDYIQLMGEVAAGVWKEVGVDDFGNEKIAMPHDPRYPKGALYALRIRGNSVNKHAKDGDIAICLDLHHAPRDYLDGDWVVARRTRGSLQETTVKRAKRKRDGSWELWPDSDDPAFQEPLKLGAQKDEMVEVLALVRHFLRDATVI